MRHGVPIKYWNSKMSKTYKVTLIRWEPKLVTVDIAARHAREAKKIAKRMGRQHQRPRVGKVESITHVRPKVTFVEAQRNGRYF